MDVTGRKDRKQMSPPDTGTFDGGTPSWHGIYVDRRTGMDENRGSQYYKQRPIYTDSRLFII